MRILLLSSLAWLVVGCAVSHREPRAANDAVEPPVDVTLAKADPPPQCEEVGTDYEMIVWGDFDGARRKLRRHAAERGGNYVRLEMPAGGTIYRCPVAAPMAQLPPTPAASGGLMPPPAPKPESVRLMKSDPPSGCSEVGMVAEAIWFGDVEGARNRLKQKAMALGANYVRLEMPTTGTAFRCP